MKDIERKAPLSELIVDREKLVEAVREFDQMDQDSQLFSEEIQAAIEELRPIRLMIRELNYLIKAALDSVDEG
jgi:hypothetical protein